MNGIPRKVTIGLCLALSTVAASLLSVTEAAQLWVANDGVDSVNCGARTNQCRSISQAIDNASDGDTISVGQGLYGDLNGDGQLNGPGEEHGSAAGLPCDVCVTKSLTITSIHGADQTVIVGTNFSVVGLSGHYVTFGVADHGFTIIGGGNGLLADSPQFMHVSVAGNVALNNGRGFSIQNFGSALISHNRAVGSTEIGFVVSNVYALSVTLDQNTAVNSGVTGFLVWANGAQLTNNTADRTLGGNGLQEFVVSAGFMIQGAGFVLDGNSALGNAGAGFVFGHEPNSNLPASVLSFRHNDASGNVGPGVVLFAGSKVGNFSANNIFGNATTDKPVLGSSAKNCGIVNASGGALQAAANFWGAPSGPGPDPADAVSGPNCDRNGSVTSFKPFATEFQ
jgi:hypothetical protein